LTKILFDGSQNERGKLFSNFTNLRTLLEFLDYEVDLFNDNSITFKKIKNYDIFVFACPDQSKLYGHEIKEIIRYVEEGGSLLILSNAGGDKGLGTNMNAVLNHFDLELENNQVMDEIQNMYEMPSYAIINQFEKHKITEGLERVCFIIGCSLKVGEKARGIIRSAGTAEPENTVCLAIHEGEKGKVCVFGSYLSFCDRSHALKFVDNARFAVNLFSWLSNSESKKNTEFLIERVFGNPLTPEKLEEKIPAETLKISAKAMDAYFKHMPNPTPQKSIVVKEPYPESSIEITTPIIQMKSGEKGEETLQIGKKETTMEKSFQITGEKKKPSPQIFHSQTSKTSLNKPNIENLVGEMRIEFSNFSRDLFYLLREILRRLDKITI